MLNPDDLYDLAPGAVDLDRPVLLVVLNGFVDAGGATRILRDHLVGTLGSSVVATFDLDQLLDYRSRRPPMLLVKDHWESYEPPSLVVRLLRDEQGAGFLLLDGPEPDLQWNRFVAAVGALVEHFGVRLTVGLTSIPIAAPHTRPAGVTAHATRADLIHGHESTIDQVQVPASVALLLEYQLGRAGRDAAGFAAHVPHYLAQTSYPPATEELLGAIVTATGLALPRAALAEQSAQARREIDTQVAASEEVRTVVRNLEEQYDAYVRGRQGDNLLAGPGGPLPTADELGAELERFLAEQSDRGDGSSTSR
ncbi:MAG: proteasome assembly chaperone family protein [Actinomycetes bacterium]